MKANLTSLKRLINKHTWYFQGAAFVTFTGSFPMAACTEFRARGRKLAVSFRGTLGYLSNEFVRWWFSRDTMACVADYYSSCELQRPGWIKALFKSWRINTTPRLEQVWREQMQLDFSVMENSELVGHFKRFAKIYTAWWQECIFLDAFDSEGDRLLRTVAEQVKVPDNVLVKLTTPKVPTSLQEQRFDLLRISKLVLKDRQSTKLVKRGNLGLWSKWHLTHYRQLQKHSNNFFWINGDYVKTPELGVKYFFKLLRKLVVNRHVFEQELAEQSQVSSITRRQALILRRYKIPANLRHLTGVISILVTWRDLRKKYNIMANYLLLNRYLPELENRTRLPKEYLFHLYHNEFQQVLNNPSSFHKVLRMRHQGRFIVFKPGPAFDEYGGVDGKKLRKLIEYRMNEIYKHIKGMPAYPGRVRGRVKIILHSDDFHKIKRGDILVAPNTRPEYVPIMKLASAILSDEGGITSHTAIVAREYRIPCIVGCQVATSALKDGDIIEVDAINGMVTKL